jgi:hypothetical protein
LRHQDTRTAITPITLRPRQSPSSATESGVHALQSSLFGASWTLAMAVHLAQAGADSVTFYNDVDELWSAQTSVFPLFHVLADVCECAGATVVAGTTDAELRERADSAEDDVYLLVDCASRAVLLMANLSRQQRTMRVPTFFAANAVRVLDETTVRYASADCEDFRAERRSVNGLTTIELGPFATARIDGHLTGGR